MSSTEVSKIEELAGKEYKYGFVTDIEADSLPNGLNEDIIRQLSAKKKEPEFMLECELPLTSGMKFKPEDLIHVKIQHVDARKDILSVFLSWRRRGIRDFDKEYPHK